MNTINHWISENKTAASIGLAFLLVTGIGGWLTFQSWNDYSAAAQSYTDAVGKLTKLQQQNPFPSEANRIKLEADLNREQAAFENLTKALQSYRVPAFNELDKAKPQNRPQLFQDALRSQVTAVKNSAASKGVTLPPSFYLGMEYYENRPPTPEETFQLARQLTVLNWIAEALASRENLILSEFSRVLPSSPAKPAESSKKTTSPLEEKTKTPYETIGSMRVSFRCDQSSLRELLNTISSAPYFLVIESVQIQNSVTEPPRRNAPNQQEAQQQQPTDVQATSQRLPIIVGREQMNVALKIRCLEFSAPQVQQIQQPQQAAK